ncbi:ssl1498 family light-harvesting-like protein [Candidatus Synechococcus calcipolaris G9]|uniref:Ssl1498 family light-harvesting-like protein n=1 Tax=Candidatus Synechococcus calcipolaris G9 TaxID=1497997 RepID=A0ABT6F0Z3_9SYNE|nr:ssl1498 family light-harvesting-like protein [Candidatus Synechococcus calcipolaris]MDG2991499.1 ssl1498 family light-harvesting-like protein [Candidatus Synechococcus calcipolaris G9]
MPYTVDDDGRLNNFAVEPQVYEAKPPSQQEKKRFLILGSVGLLLVLGLITIAFVVS